MTASMVCVLSASIQLSPFPSKERLNHSSAVHNFLNTNSNCTACLLGKLLHRYDFNNRTALDAVGGCEYAAALEAGATVEGGQLRLRSSSLNSGATGGYMRIPSSVLVGYDSFTIEVWFSTGVNSHWARLFQLGAALQSMNSLMLSIDDPSGLLNLCYVNEAYTWSCVMLAYSLTGSQRLTQLLQFPWDSQPNFSSTGNLWARPQS